MTDEDATVPKSDLLKALHRVYVESLPHEEHRNSPKLGTSRTDMPFLDALDVLAASDDLDQLQKWHVAASSLARRPELLDDAEALDGFVALVAAPAHQSLGGSLDDLDALDELVASTVRDGLQAFAAEVAAIPPESPSRRLARADWERFHDLVLVPLNDVVQDLATSQPVQPSPSQRFTLDKPFTKPGCNDESVDPVGGTPTIVSRFWSSLPLDKFKWYVNPKSWPTLGSEYWQSMTVRPGSEEQVPGGYTATFDEVVDLPSGVINAQLRVTYTATNDYVLTSYHETTTRADAVVRDAGYLFATSREFPPEDGYPTLVYSTKTIWFADDELNGWADLACDNGWVDLMIRMAIPEERTSLPRRGDQPAPEPGGVPEHDYGADELDDFVDKTREAIDSHVGAIKSAVGATIDGELGKQHLEPILVAYDHWVDVAGAGAKAWRRVVADLSDAWGPR